MFLVAGNATVIQATPWLRHSVQGKLSLDEAIRTYLANRAANSDIDRDGVINQIDNLVFVPNPDQLDSDSDGVGDVPEHVQASWQRRELKQGLRR